MQRIFALPDDAIDSIFEFFNPYKTRYDLILYDLRWNQFWYRCFSEWFVTNHRDFKSYILHRNRNNGVGYLRV